MPDQDVSIQYRAIVTGVGDVKSLASANAELNNQLESTKTKTNDAVEASKKHQGALTQVHKAAREFHRELYGGAAVISLVTVALTSMARGSESAQIGLESLTGWMNKLGGSMANALAKATAFYGALSGGANIAQALDIAQKQTDAARSLDTQVKVLAMEAQMYKLQGDELMALTKKHEAEQTALKKEGNTQRYQILKDALDREQIAEREAYKLSEIGLKNHFQIMSDFKKNFVGGALQGSTQNILEKTLSGERQSIGDVAKTFQQGFAHAISEALSQSLWSSLLGGQGDIFSRLKDIFTGDSPAKRAAERSARAAEETVKKNDEMLNVLRQIAECTCSTAQSISRGYTATITPPGTSGLQKAQAIFGAIGSLGSLGGFGGGGSSSPPSLTIGPGVYNPNSSGGRLSFPSGGEVPITAQPGEYIVRRGIAAQHKDLLNDLNAGMTPVKGAQHVFIINANDAASFASMLSSPSAREQIEVGVIRAIMSNGNLRNIIKSYAR